MLAIAWTVLWLILGIGQAEEPAAYIREGDRVEQQFREYRNNLDGLFKALRAIAEAEASHLLHQLNEAPPEPVVLFLEESTVGNRRHVARQG